MQEIFTKEDFLKEFADNESADEFERNILKITKWYRPSWVDDVLDGSEPTSEYWKFLILTAKYVKMRQGFKDGSTQKIANKVRNKLSAKRLQDINSGIDQLHILTMNLLSCFSRENAIFVLTQALKRWVENEVLTMKGAHKDAVDDLEYRTLAIYWVDGVLHRRKNEDMH